MLGCLSMILHASSISEHLISMIGSVDRPLGGVSLPRRRLSPRMESTTHVTAMCLDHVLVTYYARATLSTINYEVDSSETSGISR